MTKKTRKVDFNLASEVFEDASLTDSFQQKSIQKTLVPIAALKTNPFQPRIQMDQDAIVELANSITQSGLLQPITVLSNSDDTFTIVFGHRRVAAYEFLNKKDIEANILTSLENDSMVIAPIVENMQRKDMQPLETAMALNRVLMMGIIKTQSELATLIGISQGRISKLLSILKLSDDVLKSISKNDYRDATVLAAINQVDQEKQIEIFELIRVLPRDEALSEIKKFVLNKPVSIKRVHHTNTTIKISTKGLPKVIKEKIYLYVKEIENLLENEK